MATLDFTRTRRFIFLRNAPPQKHSEVALVLLGRGWSRPITAAGLNISTKQNKAWTRTEHPDLSAGDEFHWLLPRRQRLLHVCSSRLEAELQPSAGQECAVKNVRPPVGSLTSSSS